jgi:hypothetical protein
MSFNAVIKRPSAFLPLICSGVALAVVLGHVAIYGVVREADEGAAAHLFQLLMVLQAPIVVYFAARWVPREGKSAWSVLALQVGAAILALAPVFILEL